MVIKRDHFAVKLSTTLSKVTGSISAVATPIEVFGVCFRPESSSLIGHSIGSVHYFYVTEGGRFSNLHKWFINIITDQKRTFLVLVGLITNHDHFFCQYFLNGTILASGKKNDIYMIHMLWIVSKVEG